MSDYSKRGELVNSESTSIKINDEKYRVGISVRYNGDYKVSCSVLRIRSTTPHDIIDDKRKHTREKENVQEIVQELVEWGINRAKDQEDALNLDISVQTTVEGQE